MNEHGSEDLVLTAGLPAGELDERLRAMQRRCDVGHRGLAFYLADMEVRGVHQALGMPSAVAYAVTVLGMRRRSAREHVAVGRRLEELPKIDAAFAEGSVSWSRVRAITRVATAETEEEWLDYAKGCTQDELDVQVRRARPGDAPRKEGLPAPRFALHVELDALQYEIWQNARAKLEAEIGGGEQLTDEMVLQEMLELVLRSDADGTVPGRKVVDGSAFKVVVADKEEGKVVVGDGGDVPIDEATFERARSDAVTPEKLRRRVRARDGERCRHCSSPRNLHVHHVVWRSLGGRTEADNLVTLCSKCHGLVHERWLEVAQCATGFVFTDANERIIRRTVLMGPRVRKEPGAEVAQCATAGEVEVPDVIDRAWLDAHPHEFVWKHGKLALRLLA